MTITAQVMLECNEDGCTDTRLLFATLHRDRHLDSGYTVDVSLPDGWTSEIIGGGHRCELHEDVDHKRERLAYEERNRPEAKS